MMELLHYNLHLYFKGIKMGAFKVAARVVNLYWRPVNNYCLPKVDNPLVKYGNFKCTHKNLNLLK
jgi:hypothetical protein